MRAVAGDQEIGARIRQVRAMRGNLTQEAFAKKLHSVTRGAVGNWERGKGIKRENLLAIADVFGVAVEWLAQGTGPMDANPSNAIGPVNDFPSDRRPAEEKTIPLYGQVVGGEDGEFVLNTGDILDRIPAPPGLRASGDAYAVIVTGESMEPRYEDGETVFVDPARRPTRGSYVVAQIQYAEAGPRLAYVKRFVRHTDKELVLEQFNPAKELRFPHDSVVAVHVVTMSGRLP